MPISSYHFRAAVLYAVIGMLMGITMAASHDFSLTPAHAHLNLLGWVSATLYGLFLRTHPHAGSRRLKSVHFCLAHGGVIAMTSGLVLLVHGMTRIGEAFAILGGILSLAGIVLFAILVFLGTRHVRSSMTSSDWIGRANSYETTELRAD